MVARVERKGHAIHTCKQCGRTDEPGEWYWVNPACDKCSLCFPPCRRDIKGVTYSQVISDKAIVNQAEYDRRKQRRHAARSLTLLDDMQQLMNKPRTVAWLAARLGMEKKTIRTQITENPALFVCVRKEDIYKHPALWQLKSAAEQPPSPASRGVSPHENDSNHVSKQ